LDQASKVSRVTPGAKLRNFPPGLGPKKQARSNPNQRKTLTISKLGTKPGILNKTELVGFQFRENFGHLGDLGGVGRPNLPEFNSQGGKIFGSEFFNFLDRAFFLNGVLRGVLGLGFKASGGGFWVNNPLGFQRGKQKGEIGFKIREILSPW